MERIPLTLTELVEMVLNYLWDAEERDFEEGQTQEACAPHIFEALVVLKHWLEGERKRQASTPSSKRRRT